MRQVPYGAEGGPRYESPADRDYLRVGGEGGVGRGGGQTGAGKTHTMMGGGGDAEGVIPRSIRQASTRTHLFGRSIRRACARTRFHR